MKLRRNEYCPIALFLAVVGSPSRNRKGLNSSACSESTIRIILGDIGNSVPIER